MASPSVGRFTWHELASPDIASAVKFYAALLGWTVQEAPMGPMGTYYTFMKGETGVGGGMSAPPGVPPHWLAYVHSADTDATAKKIVELGGKVMVPPTDVPGMVRFAVGVDPQGAAFGVVKDISGRAETPVSDAPPLPGTFCWDELHTKDLEAAAKYYGALFGWTGKTSEGAMKYWHWNSAGHDIGGMMELMMPGVPPNWLAYIAVADVDASTAKVKELGDKVVVPVQDIEKVGKFSIVQDPTGATFSLFRSARV